MKIPIKSAQIRFIAIFKQSANCPVLTHETITKHHFMPVHCSIYKLHLCDRLSAIPILDGQFTDVGVYRARSE